MINLLSINARVESQEDPDKRASSTTATTATTATSETTEPLEPIYSSLVIRIEYTLEEPRNGVVFVQKDEEIAPYVSIDNKKKTRVNSFG